MTDPDLNLDTTRTTSRSLADLYGHTIADLMELLRLNRELIPDL